MVLEELQVSATEQRIDADLACGRDAELVGELQSLIAEHPVRRVRMGDGEVWFAIFVRIENETDEPLTVQLRYRSHKEGQTAWRTAPKLIVEPGQTLPVRDGEGQVKLARDEWVHADLTIEKLVALPPAFAEIGSQGADTILLGETAPRGDSTIVHPLRFLSERMDDGTARKSIEENLADERDDDHPGLWVRFAEALGEQRAALETSEVETETAACVDAFATATKESSVPFALGMLYAYESQTPGVAATKIEGLRSHYGIDGPALEYFELHGELDVEHSGDLAEAIAGLANDETARAVVTGQRQRPVAKEGKAKERRR